MTRDAATSALPSTIQRWISLFTRKEDGGITPYGLLLFLATMAISATALDVSRLMSVRSHLQVAADAGAHAALYLRERLSKDDAIAGAVSLVRGDLPENKYGVIVDETDVTFGTYDPVSRTLTPDEDSREAVRVRARASTDRMNAVQSYLFKLVGYDTFNVRAEAIYETYRPTCLTEGFAADGVVDVQSNNLYSGGFCVHSNTYVSLNSNNTFEPGTIVSMPNPDEVDLPRSGFDTNDGLREALRAGKYRLRVVDRLEAIIQGLEDGDPDYLPDYVNGTSAIELSLQAGKATQDDFTPGRIHTYTCRNNGKMTITTEEGSPLHDIVLVTNCEIKFSEGAELENVVIATTSTSAKSMNAPNGLTVGKDDACAEGGDAQLLTMGSMDFAADLSLFGAQLMAKQDISFSANANGIEGASMVAGGEISGTSNMAMGYCGTGVANNYAVDYFRLRR